MPASELAQALAADREAGLIPFVVIPTCGTTNTGSVDPFEELAGVCQRENVWMHVDGAYGASASLSKDRTGVARGLGHADRLSWDGHKWLFQTFGCGLVLVKEKNHLLESFGIEAEYLRDATEEVNVPDYWSHGIELTRPACAMKLWFTLRTLSVEKAGEMIDHGFILAERAEKELRGLSDWVLTSPASMAILTLGFSRPERSPTQLNALNGAISKRLVAENVAGILMIQLRGQIVFRMCAIHPLLTEEQMLTIILNVDRVARKVFSESV